jgi:hypothetical protein
MKLPMYVADAPRKINTKEKPETKAIVEKKTFLLISAAMLFVNSSVE